MNRAGPGEANRVAQHNFPINIFSSSSCFGTGARARAPHYSNEVLLCTSRLLIVVSGLGTDAPLIRCCVRFALSPPLPGCTIILQLSERHRMAILCCLSLLQETFWAESINVATRRVGGRLKAKTSKSVKSILVAGSCRRPEVHQIRAPETAPQLNKALVSTRVDKLLTSMSTSNQVQEASIKQKIR